MSYGVSFHYPSRRSYQTQLLDHGPLGSLLRFSYCARPRHDLSKESATRPAQRAPSHGTGDARNLKQNVGNRGGVEDSYSASQLPIVFPLGNFAATKPAIGAPFFMGWTFIDTFVPGANVEGR